MKSKSLYYFVALALLAMLPLVGCSGGNGSSITSDPSGKVTASISGVVEVDKSVAKSVGATAGALGTVEVFNAYSSANKKALGSAEVLANGSFTGLNFTLPDTQSVVVFKATLTGPPESKLYNITPMDLTSPPSGLVNNNIKIVINTASTTTATVVMKANGAELDKWISPAKAFSAVAYSVVANGGSVLSYAGTGIKLDGTVGGASSALLPASTAAPATVGDIAVTSIVPLTIGDDLKVTFNVKVNGAAKTNYDTVASDYRLALVNATLSRSDVSDTLGAAQTLVSNGSGNYTLTIPGAAKAFGTVNSRYLFTVRNAAENALASAARPLGYRAIVLFDFPAAPITDLLGSTSTSCADCHGSFGNGFHNGYPSYGGKTCTVCHDAQNKIADSSTKVPLQTVDMIHGIHRSGSMPTKLYTAKRPDGTEVTHTVDGKVVPYTYAIAFPTYMDNCSICHQAGAPLTAANSKAVSYNLCMTCHQNWDGYAASTFGGLSSHKNMTATGNCAVCHDGATAPATIGAIHNKAELSTGNGGLLYNGVDLSVTEGANTVVTIKSVAKDGNNLVIKWGAKYKGVDTDPCFAGSATSSKPAFAGNRTLVDHGTSTTLIHNFAFLKGFFTGDDITNAGNGNLSPGQPNSVDVVFPGQPSILTPVSQATKVVNTACTATEATTTIPLTTAEQALAASSAKLRVGLQGKPVLYEDTAKKFYYLRAKSPVYDLDLKTNKAVTTFRRGSTNQYNSVTETDKCLKCHVGSLYQHGGNRVDNVELCIMCHNEASSDHNNRVAMGVTASEAYDGKAAQTYGLKTMLHAIHASGKAGQDPLVIYRTRGIYAFAPLQSALLNNWPGASTTATLVNGGDPTALNSSGGQIAKQPHNFVTAHYPRKLNDCAACHATGFSVIPDPTKAVATTISAGAAPWTNQLDDTLEGAASAACTSCHRSKAADAHANQNSWVPMAFTEGRKTVMDQTDKVESCAACHGSGRTAGVAEVHVK